MSDHRRYVSLFATAVALSCLGLVALHVSAQDLTSGATIEIAVPEDLQHTQVVTIAQRVLSVGTEGHNVIANARFSNSAYMEGEALAWLGDRESAPSLSQLSWAAAAKVLDPKTTGGAGGYAYVIQAKKDQPPKVLAKLDVQRRPDTEAALAGLSADEGEAPPSLANAPAGVQAFAGLFTHILKDFPELSLRAGGLMAEGGESDATLGVQWRFQTRTKTVWDGQTGFARTSTVYGATTKDETVAYQDDEGKVLYGVSRRPRQEPYWYIRVYGGEDNEVVAVTIDLVATYKIGNRKVKQPTMWGAYLGWGLDNKKIIVGPTWSRRPSAKWSIIPVGRAFATDKDGEHRDDSWVFFGVTVSTDSILP